jgi:hypothetical protein
MTNYEKMIVLLYLLLSICLGIGLMYFVEYLKIKY